MFKPAKEVVSNLGKNYEKTVKESLRHLLATCNTEITEMERLGLSVVEFKLSDEDLLVVGDVVEQLRDSGYRSCLIEVQNNDGDRLQHKLRISLRHLES